MLGAATATETIERALDLVVFQHELVRGTRAMLGVEIVALKEIVRSSMSKTEWLSRRGFNCARRVWPL